jgi:hypothetical protein
LATISEFSMTALGASREQAVKAAVERDVGDDRNQHRRQHRDHREQADDLDMQPRRGPCPRRRA